MTPGRTLRPVFVLLVGALVASCGSENADAVRFETMARRVAEIPLEGNLVDGGRAARPVASAAEMGLRGAIPTADVDTPLQVQVMDPHDLWDARDGLRPAFAAASDAAETVSEIRKSAVAASTLANTSIANPSTARPVVVATAVEVAPQPRAASARTVIQLGAYSRPEAARAAWIDAVAGEAGAALRSLTPIYETVEVNGRSFTRLRVSAPAATAAAICAAVEVADPWCRAAA